MWIETDHHGLVNLDYIKRVDLAGDIDSKTFGIYLFDVDGTTFPVVDMPRFANIGIFQGKETNQDIHLAVYTFYTVTKTLLSKAKEKDVITIEAIYKEFAAEWYAKQKEEMAENEPPAKAHKQKISDKDGESAHREPSSNNIHNLSDLKLFLDAYSETYFVKFQKKPLISYKTEGRIARELVQLYPLEKLKTMLLWYFDSSEDFIKKANYDIKTFRAILERTKKVGTSKE
jgi:hypothetical protein